MTTSTGRSAMLTINGYINSNRYSTNPAGVPDAPDYDFLHDFLAGPSPIDPDSTSTHEQLTRAVTVSKGSRGGFTVHVYENDVELPGSPFSTYGAAHKALGLEAKSRTASRFIDTGKKYRNKYIFRSTPNSPI
jgi:hypothetical protein